jgi:hypothetical protein
MMVIPHVNPEDFSRAGTRRIRTFAAAASGPMVVGAGWDGHVYVWDVETRTRVREFPTSEDSGGVSVALTPQGRECFVGTYYAWGVACLDVASKEKRWHRTDLKKVYGLATSASNVVFRKTVREWSDAVFCADGAFLEWTRRTVRHVDGRLNARVRVPALSSMNVLDAFTKSADQVRRWSSFVRCFAVP